ncbi:MAG TPA: tetratricopeptide repeat protein [Streptosporangiaceae bacterium]
MGDFSRRLRPIVEGLDADTSGTAFLGDAQVGGDVVAGNKILQLPPEQRTLPAQLPADISGFTGRHGVLTQLDRLIAGDGPRTAIITAIHGMAGVGKTALAVHWAHRVAGRFPDGQLYVDMRGYSATAAMTPAEALGRFLRALGVPDERIPEDEDERAALYRSVLANRRALIILDNASSPQQVRPLLPGSPTCRTLVTSRNQLSSLVAHSGAQTLPVDVLTPDEAAGLMTTILGGARVAAEPNAVEQLAQQCTYLPLALRIAAAHVAIGTYGTIAELVAELAAGNRLTTLECDDDPHLAVRCAFDLSYRHLAEPERRTFRHTGLIEGPDFTPHTMTALLDESPDRVRRSIRILANAHLIEPKSAGRFRLHDLLREYAQERVREEETREVHHAAVRRLAEWYVANATAYAYCLDPCRPRITADPPNPAEHVAAIPWFEAERAGIIAIARQIAQLRMGSPGWELADAAYDFFRRRRYNDENIELHRLALTAARACADRPAQVYMLHHLAALQIEQGRYGEALALAKEALDLDARTADILHVRRNIGIIHLRTGQYAIALGSLARDLSSSQGQRDRRGEAETLTVIGMVHRDLGQHDKAIDSLRQALEVQRGIADRRGEAITLNRLAAVRHWWLGQYRQSAADARAALHAQRDCGDRAGQAETLYTLSFITHQMGQPRRAVRYAQRSLAISRAVGDRMGEGRALFALAWVYRKLGHYRLAESFARQGLEIDRDIGDRYGEARALESLARNLHYERRLPDAYNTQLLSLRLREGIGEPNAVGRARTLLARYAIDLDRPADALRYAEESLGIHREIGDRRSEGATLQCLARVHRKLGHYSEAVVCARTSLTIRRDVRDRRGEAESLDSLARAHLAMDHYDDALDYAKQALAVVRHIDYPFGQGWALDHLGRIYLAMGDPQRAVRHFEDALRIRRRIRDRYGQGRTLSRLARVYVTLGRHKAALAAAERSLDIERDTLQPDALAERLAEIARITEQTQGG